MATNGSGGGETLISLTVQRLQAISETKLTGEVETKVNLAVLDYLGAVASGLQAPWASQAIKYASSQQGVKEAHAWGLGEDANAKTAAYLNALLAHSAIRDDMHLKSNSHIGSIVISAALALAQRDGWTGEQIMKAIVAGYEAASFLGMAVQQSPGYNRHMRPSGICGAFGAAAAAVTGGQVSRGIAVNALAFAANMSGGFNEWAWAGGVEIYTEMGSAAQAGIDAFQLAKAGMQCSETLLEGRAGLFAAFAASDGAAIFKERLQSDVGSGIMNVRFKPAPGCNYAQTPLAVALRIAQKHDFSRGIQGVSVDCTSGAKQYPGCDNPGPFTNVQQTKMSIQYGVCAVLLHGSVTEEVFAKFGSEEIATLASTCSVEQSKEYESDFQAGRQPARVRVRLRDGSEVSEELSDVPWLEASAVRSRYHEEVGRLLGQKKAARLADTLNALADVQDSTIIWRSFKG